MIRQVMMAGGGGSGVVRFTVTCAENSAELPLTGYSGSAEDIRVILAEQKVATIAGMPEKKVIARIGIVGGMSIAYTNGAEIVAPTAYSFSKDPLKFTSPDASGYQFKGTYDVTVYTV